VIYIYDKFRLSSAAEETDYIEQNFSIQTALLSFTDYIEQNFSIQTQHQKLTKVLP
jgi:hypothetical protein